MATTLLAVCNRALSKIGAPRINALTDDNPSALALAACLPGVPDWVLRAYPVPPVSEQWVLPLLIYSRVTVGDGMGQ